MGTEPGRVRGTASERRDRSGAARDTGTARGHRAGAFVTSGAGQLTGSGCYRVTVAWQRCRGAAMADDDLLPVVSFGNLMSEGITLSRRGQHDKALGCFNDALKLRAGDKHCLITRSKCFLKLGHTENSLKDAEASLQIDNTFYEVTS
uniref:Uncharacterized protein n=1 Tax=Geospiza parvula TaxID=87175 RepID=A0A8U8C3G1_GEOPR